MVKIFVLEKIPAYIIKNKYGSMFLGYMITAVIVKALGGIDVTMPCLIKLTTGHSCYGCGLTTAFIYILKLDFEAAFEANALIFVFVPALMGLLLWDFRRNYSLL